MEYEIGRRAKTPRKERLCRCGKAIGTTEHVLETCRLHDSERRITKIRLKELGMEDTDIWNLVKKAGGPMKPGMRTVERRRKIISETNALIGRIMNKRDEGKSSQNRTLRTGETEELEEGRELMRRTLEKIGIRDKESKRKREKERRNEALPENADDDNPGIAEQKILRQRINEM